MAWVHGFVNYKKGCIRFAAASDKVYHGRWFSPGTLASSTTKTGRHDIAEILLKVALRHQKSKSVTKILNLKCHTNEQRSNKYTNRTFNQMFMSVHNTMNVSKVIYKCRAPILLLPVSNLCSILTLSTFTSLWTCNNASPFNLSSTIVVLFRCFRRSTS